LAIDKFWNGWGALVVVPTLANTSQYQRVGSIFTLSSGFIETAESCPFFNAPKKSLTLI
jgi:hypothetical protein